MIHTTTRRIGAREITIETGKIAKLADGAVTVTSGQTTVLVTAVSATTLKDGQDFFPLTVDYREKASASGRYPGGYFKREGRPSEKDILTCRMIDRPLRPMFPNGYLYDTQIIGLLLSADEINDPDILCINGASAALCVSDIPFDEPIGAVRVALVEGKFIVNPTFEERQFSDLDLVYAGSETEVIMIEGAAQQIAEEKFVEALNFAHGHVRELVLMQKELAAAVNKQKREWTPVLVQDELLEVAYGTLGDRIGEALVIPGKVDRQKATDGLKKEVAAAILAQFPDATPFAISQAFDYIQKKNVRSNILDKDVRMDGRPLDKVRQLHAEVDVYPMPHGTALFSRGETQALCITTLGSLEEAQELDAYAGGEDTKRFILHYNFPPFSVGETGRTGSPGRREIGHGALAERSIEPVLPTEDEFPYAIRVVSEVMESNGSTSMASVCGGVLALLDAGVPLRATVAGISVGLITEYNGRELSRYKMLTDIIGKEDHFGDMDFKLCGTRHGVTGFQLDLKLRGISLEIMAEAIYRARDARGEILDVMNSALPHARSTMKENAPRIETVKINPDKIGALIGPGGKIIKGIQAETGAEININDDGTVKIYCNNGAGMQRAREMVMGVTKEIEVGEVYHARVVSIKEFGAFVEALPGKEGLVHISELADFRVNRTEDVVKPGDYIWVKCIGIDNKGRVKMSRKAAMKDRGETARGDGEAAPEPVVEDVD
jgi:polyribonucleotide nucleotidyltransferase